jgi:ABC-type enterochelin transport system substrate-binding protein
MGFDLKMMFDELIEILNSDKKAAKKVKELSAAIAAAKKYAEECGQLR